MKIKYLFFLLFISCSTKFFDRGFHIYKQRTNQDISRILVFNNDGTYNFKQEAKLASFESQGTWLKKGNKLYLETKAEFRFFNYKPTKGNVQEKKIEIIIKDSDGDLVEGVTVRLGKKLIKTTNFNGRVTLPLLKEEELFISYLDTEKKIVIDFESYNTLEVTMNFERINNFEFQNELFVIDGKSIFNEDLGKFNGHIRK